MRRFGLGLMLMMLLACDGAVEKPPHLMPREEMAEMIAELALAEQSFQYDPKASQDATVREILKRHQVRPQQFIDSYRYYAVKKQMPEIITKAQEKLTKDYPAAAAKLKEREKTTGAQPDFNLK